MQIKLKKAFLVIAVVIAALDFSAFAVAPHKGVIRVKLQPEVARQVGSKARMRASGNMQTGATLLDNAVESVNAVSIRPMLPYSAKFAKQRAEYGLDRWYVVTFDERVTPGDARKLFAKTAGVERAELVTPMSLKEGKGKFRVLDRNAVAKANEKLPFNDPFLGRQWHYKNFGTIPYSVAGADINLFDAWKSVTGNKDVVVAIIDGGIDYNHEDLAANVLINEKELNGTPGVDDDGNGYVDDVYGWNFCTNEPKIHPHQHGTHVAGTVGAVSNNGIGVAGVAGGDGTPGSGVKMLSCQVFDSRQGTGDGDFAAALVYAAERGASIAQCSWGWDAVGYYEQAVLDAIDYFTDKAQSPVMKGGLCIFAMGNTGETGDFYPGVYDRVIGVTAMTSELTPAPYSSNSPKADITAPGGLLDFGDAQGVLSTLPNNTYGASEGTSMATPHVSGIAALVLSKYGSPDFLNETLRTQLLTSVNDFYGYGNNSSVAYNFGTGYIDAAKAVTMNREGHPETIKDFDLQAAQDYISVTWTIPASSDNNVNSHVIYYSKEKFDASSDLTKIPSKIVDTKFLSSGDVHTEEITGLESLTTYYVAIRAVNRWGNSSDLSPVKQTSTNAGPKITVAQKNVSMSSTAAQPVAEGLLTIGNEAEGLLKWQGAKRTVSASLHSVQRANPGNVKPYSGSVAGLKAKPFANVVKSDYSADEYPVEIKNFESIWAMIGDTDKSLPNSMAQWFRVDPTAYPEGFNLTDLWFEAFGMGGTNPKIEIYKGDVAISRASLIAEVDYDFFAYNYNIPLKEQLWFAPGESFWVVAHFAPGQENYPLGMGTSAEGAQPGWSYMSNDNGETWTQLSAALKGSPYEDTAEEYNWAIRARSLNPDWSSMLELTPSEGSVKMGETQDVKLTADGKKLVNGTYDFKVRLSTNETGNKVTSIPVTLTVDGNRPEMVVPKVVDFGSLLVGQTKTLQAEVYNKGYGSFRGSQWGAGIYSDNIEASSENFAGPEYVQSGFPARATTVVELTYAPKSAGSHNGYVTFKGMDGNEFRILVQGVATDPAKLAVEPAVIDAGTIAIGDASKELTFTVRNDGKYPLEFVFPKFSDENVEGAAKQHKFGYTVASTLEGFNEFEYQAPSPVIGATNIASRFTDDIYVSNPVSLGFSFPYYGKEYDTAYITSFGGIMFATTDETMRSPLYPGAYGVTGTGLISAYGWQLQMGPDSKVEYGSQNGKFVVNFENVLALVYASEYAPVSFRIALSPNGDIEMFYDNYEAANFFQDGSQLYCGINDFEDADPITLTSSEMADYWGSQEPTADNTRFRLFTTGTAIKFEAPQTQFVDALTPAYGLVSPGESVEVKATVSVNDRMNAGETYNNLAIVTNDPVPALSAVRVNAVVSEEGMNASASVAKDKIALGEIFRTSDVNVPVAVKNAGHNTLTVTGVDFSSNSGMTVTTEFPVVLKPGASVDVIVNVPTDKEGDFADNLTVHTSDKDLTVAISGKVIGVPVASLSFSEINETVASGDALSKTLEISNTGNEPLVYSMTGTQDATVTMPESKSSKVDYTYASSVDGKATFEWVDIETNGLGVQTPFRTYNQQDYITVDLPFEFQFYGKKYRKMYIYNTGFVSFTERRDDKIWPEPPAEFPTGSIYTNIIAPYWGLHSMNTTKTAGTYHYVTDDRAVVSFMEYGNSMNIGVCFQLIMEKDGSFKFQYKPYDEYAQLMGSFGLAGITDADGEEYLRLPDRMIAFGNAVQFLPVRTNTVAPGAKEEVDVKLNTDRLAGFYESAIAVNTNEPKPAVTEIPVSLTVTGEAKPVIPASAEVTRTVGFMSTDYSDPLVQMGLPYAATFNVANEGTAAFTLTDVSYEAPMGDFGPEFMLMANLPEIDWITGEPTGDKMWQSVEPGFFSPVQVGKEPFEFAMGIMQGASWMTPGSYDIPVQLSYMTTADQEEPTVATVNVRFIVTPAPAMVLDKEEIRIENAADDLLATETLKISNPGEYALTYSLELDPTGVGAVEEDNPDSGIDPMLSKKLVKASEMNPVLLDFIAKADGLKKAARVDESDNIYDVPGDFEYNRSLFYNVMPGNNNAYQYKQDGWALTTAQCMKAPADGFNISHLYTAINIENKKNITIRYEIVSGSDPETGDVIGNGSLFIESQKNTTSGNFYVVPLEKPVYINPNEEFCVVAYYPESIPAYLVVKEEPVTAGRYLGYFEETDWFDAGQLFEDNYGSLGFILTCLETSAGEPWVKLLDSETEGQIEINGEKEVKVQLSAASARMDKGNKAMLVIRSNAPDAPVVNFPIYLDRNGAPTISQAAGTIYAKEGEKTIVNFEVNDADGDAVTITLTDDLGIASFGELPTAEYGSITLPAGSLPVNVAIELNPQFGHAGYHTFSIEAADSKGHATETVVSYTVDKVNRAPEALEPKTVEVIIGSVSEPVDFNTLFSDPDGDEMMYAFSFNATNLAEAYTTSTGVVFLGKKEGKAEAEVTATDAAGNSTTVKLPVEVKKTSAVDEITSDDAKLVMVAENPVKETLRLRAGFTGRATVELFSAAGSKVASFESDFHAGDVQAFAVGGNAAGVYLLRVSNGSDVQSLRILIL